MSRLVIPTNSEAQNVVEGLYKDLERRIIASPPGLCPVDLTAAFLKMCHAQTCGKCVPCRIGLAQLSNLLEEISEKYWSMQAHVRLLSIPDGRSRLEAYLAREAVRGGQIVCTGVTREQMAHYLGMNRSALSRLLGAMQREGRLELHRGSIRLLK